MVEWIISKGMIIFYTVSFDYKFSKKINSDPVMLILMVFDEYRKRKSTNISFFGKILFGLNKFYDFSFLSFFFLLAYKL